MRRHLLVLVAPVFACTALVFTFGHSADPPEVATINHAPGALMKSKLVTSQSVLEGLLRKDFDAIANGARSLKRISEAAEWPRSRDRVYEHFGSTFRRQCNELENAAHKSDQDGVMFTYLAITTTCVNCHDYVRDSRRIAQPREGDVRLIPSHWPARVSKRYE